MGSNQCWPMLRPYRNWCLQLIYLLVRSTHMSRTMRVPATWTRCWIWAAVCDRPYRLANRRAWQPAIARRRRLWSRRVDSLRRKFDEIFLRHRNQMSEPLQSERKLCELGRQSALTDDFITCKSLKHHKAAGYWYRLNDSRVFKYRFDIHVNGLHRGHRQQVACGYCGEWILARLSCSNIWPDRL